MKTPPQEKQQIIKEQSAFKKKSIDAYRTSKKNVMRYSNEIVLLLIGMVSFIFAPYLIRLIDPQAGFYGIEELQRYVYGFTGAVLAWSFAKLTIHILFPTMDAYLDLRFQTDFKKLKAWQKASLSLSFFAFLALVFTLLVMAI